jgi:hypothetical protein
MSTRRITIMERRSNWIPVIVSNPNSRNEIGTEPRFEDNASQILDKLPALQMLDEPTEGLDHQHQRRADLRFSIAVGIALALPVFIALSVYLMATLVLVAEG